MSYRERFRMLGLLVLLVVMGRSNARAQQSDDNNGPVKKIFVIAMENHNWTQPANQFSGAPQRFSESQCCVHQQPSQRNGDRHDQWAAGEHQQAGGLCLELLQCLGHG